MGTIESSRKWSSYTFLTDVLSLYQKRHPATKSFQIRRKCLNSSGFSRLLKPVWLILIFGFLVVFESFTWLFCSSKTVSSALMGTIGSSRKGSNYTSLGGVLFIEENFLKTFFNNDRNILELKKKQPPKIVVKLPGKRGFAESFPFPSFRNFKTIFASKDSYLRWLDWIF